MNLRHIVVDVGNERVLLNKRERTISKHERNIIDYTRLFVDACELWQIGGDHKAAIREAAAVWGKWAHSLLRPTRTRESGSPSLLIHILNNKDELYNGSLKFLELILQQLRFNFFQK